MMNNKSGKVFIVDDDESVRRGLSLLIRSAGLECEAFGSAEELLALSNYTGEGCIILDIFMEGKSGLELQEEISKKFCCTPIIFLSGQGDIPMSVKAMKNGAMNFLQKPVNDLELLHAVEDAVSRSRQLHAEQQETEKLKLLVDSLTAREFEVFRLLITGLLNKQIAAELDIAEHTVKLHRGNITKKLGLKSVAALVKLGQKLNL